MKNNILKIKWFIIFFLFFSALTVGDAHAITCSSNLSFGEKYKKYDFIATGVFEKGESELKDNIYLFNVSEYFKKPKGFDQKSVGAIAVFGGPPLGEEFLIYSTYNAESGSGGVIFYSPCLSRRLIQDKNLLSSKSSLVESRHGGVMFSGLLRAIVKEDAVGGSKLMVGEAGSILKFDITGGGLVNKNGSLIPLVEKSINLLNMCDGKRFYLGEEYMVLGWIEGRSDLDAVRRRIDCVQTFSLDEIKKIRKIYVKNNEEYNGN